MNKQLIENEAKQWIEEHQHPLNTGRAAIMHGEWSDLRDRNPALAEAVIGILGSAWQNPNGESAWLLVDQESMGLV